MPRTVPGAGHHDRAVQVQFVSLTFRSYETRLSATGKTGAIFFGIVVDFVFESEGLSTTRL